MGLDYSYSQPSQDETFGGGDWDSECNKVESLIRQDQAQLDEALIQQEQAQAMWARDRHTLQLAEKVDSLTFFSDKDTEQKLVRLENMVCELAKNKSKSSFDYFVAVMAMVLIFIGLSLVFL